jgi:hypothetical protein
MLHTTLKLCKEEDARSKGFEKLKASLGKDHSDTDLIPLTYIIESNGLSDALWALKSTVEDSDYLSREFAIFCARQVLSFYETKYPDDFRVRDCIDAVERYNNKEITLEELEVFKNAVQAASRTARASWVYAAESSAEAAYWAAGSAYWAASRDASTSAWAAWASLGDAASNEQALKLIDLLHNHIE